MSKQKAYNYPNPITNGNTTFRFFVYDANSINIDIYDITGYRVKKLAKSNLVPTPSTLDTNTGLL